MRSFRSAFMGSMRAWLPSRRSTAHQRGAVSMRLSGHVRSGRDVDLPVERQVLVDRHARRLLRVRVRSGGRRGGGGGVHRRSFGVVLIGVSRHTNHRDEEPARGPRRGNEGGAAASGARRHCTPPSPARRDVAPRARRPGHPAAPRARNARPALARRTGRASGCVSRAASAAPRRPRGRRGCRATFEQRRVRRRVGRDLGPQVRGVLDDLRQDLERRARVERLRRGEARRLGRGAYDGCCAAGCWAYPC